MLACKTCALSTLWHTPPNSLYPGRQVYLGQPALAKALLGPPQGQQGTKVQARLLAGIRALRLNRCMKFISVLFLLSQVLFLDWLPPSPLTSHTDGSAWLWTLASSSQESSLTPKALTSTSSSWVTGAWGCFCLLSPLFCCFSLGLCEISRLGRDAFIQQQFTEYILWLRKCSRCWGHRDHYI